MQNDVTLIYADRDDLEAIIKKGDMTICAFNFLGKLWPLYVGAEYRVELEFEQICTVEDTEVIDKTEGNIQQVNNTYQHILYGYVKDNIFYVGDLKFDFEEFNDDNQYHGCYIKFTVDRIYIEFLEKLPDQKSKH